MDDTTTTTTTAEQTPPAPEETPAAKRERASYPIRLQRQVAPNTFAGPEGPSFSTIEQAERWVRDSGEPGTVYLLARVIGARRMPPRVVEEVAL